MNHYHHPFFFILPLNPCSLSCLSPAAIDLNSPGVEQPQAMEEAHQVPVLFSGQKIAHFRAVKPENDPQISLKESHVDLKKVKSVESRTLPVASFGMKAPEKCTL